MQNLKGNKRSWNKHVSKTNGQSEIISLGARWRFFPTAKEESNDSKQQIKALFKSKK